MRPTVCVIVVAMNDQSFIAETLESMLAQTYPEIRIHVQHGSAGTDGTLAIVQRYPVTWASEVDTGFPDAANRAFEKKARGEFVMFQAGDDPLLPHCIESLVGALSANTDAGFAYGDIDYIDAFGKPFYRLRGRPYDLDELFWSNHVTTQSVLMRSDAFSKSGRFRTGIINADWDLYLRMGARYRSVYVPGLLARYRVHDRSHSLTHLGKMASSTRWVAQHTLNDPVVRSRLRRGVARAVAGTEITTALLSLLAGKRMEGTRAFVRAVKSWPRTISTKRGLITLGALILGPRVYGRLRARGREAG